MDSIEMLQNGNRESHHRRTYAMVAMGVRRRLMMVLGSASLALADPMIQVSTTFTSPLLNPIPFPGGSGSVAIHLTGASTSGDNLDSSMAGGGTDIVIGNISVTGLDNTFSSQCEFQSRIPSK